MKLLIPILALFFTGYTIAHYTYANIEIKNENSVDNCWCGGTIYGNNWKDGKHEIVLCPKTKEDYIKEFK